MAVSTRTVEYRDGEQVLEGVLFYPKDMMGPRPTVIVYHAYGGRDEFAVGRAKALAEMGYVGFAADVYGKGILGKNPEENMKLLMPFVQDRSDLLLRRIKAGFETVRGFNEVDNEKIAAIGYCFGGICVLDLARKLIGGELKGVVSFHGILSKPPNAGVEDIKAKVLVLHGYGDSVIPKQQVIDFQEEMEERNADWQVHAYGNTFHSFTVPGANGDGVGYSESAARRSWQSMKNFLAEIF